MMEDRKDHKRVSLRGSGWQILTGEPSPEPPAWLRAYHEAKAAEVEGWMDDAAGSELETIPAWLLEAGEAVRDLAASWLTDDSVPAWMQPQEPEPVDDSVPAWLQPPEPAELTDSPLDIAAGIPVWMQSPPDEGTDPVIADEASIPAWMQHEESDAVPVWAGSEDDEGAIPAWLALENEENVPAWLRPETGDQAESVPGWMGQVIAARQEDTIPWWLQQVIDAGEHEEAEDSELATIPRWLLEELTPAWLKASPAAAIVKVVEDSLPWWLEQAAKPLPPLDEEAEEIAVPPAEEELPAWVMAMEDEEGAPHPTREDEVPEWVLEKDEPAERVALDRIDAEPPTLAPQTLAEPVRSPVDQSGFDITTDGPIWWYAPEHSEPVQMGEEAGTEAIPLAERSAQLEPVDVRALEDEEYVTAPKVLTTTPAAPEESGPDLPRPMDFEALEDEVARGMAEDEPLVDLNPVIAMAEARRRAKEQAKAIAKDAAASAAAETTGALPPEMAFAVEGEAEAAALETMRDMGFGEDPFKKPPRRTSDELFAVAETKPDPELLRTLIPDERLSSLWQEIDALQREIVENVGGDRTLTDTHQQELLRASNLLLEGRHNYDKARAIVYRIRGDLARERKVEEWTARYGKGLIAYYGVWGVVLVALAILGPQIAQLGTRLGISAALVDGYAAALWGAFGGLVGAIWVLLNRRTRRDFDPSQLTWYIFNPVLGLVMGVIAYVIFYAGIVSSAALAPGAESALNDSPFALYIFCFLAGNQQQVVLDLLNRFRKVVAGGESESAKG